MARRQLNITAFLYDKAGHVLAVGKNSYTTTHALQIKYARKAGLPDKRFLHAEIHAIAQCQDLSKVDRILVTRFNRQGKARMAKPCPICAAALQDLGITKVEYTVNE